MPATQQAHAGQKFKIEKIATGGVTFLALHGVVDEGFEGKKTAEAVKTKKLVVSLRDVRRFASWGMAEWMNFLRGIGEHDFYLVEASAYAVNQMNLVTGLMGHGKLVSFYAPYRCGRCGEEFEDAMVVPLDRDAIRDIANIEKTCATCGGVARMDKYPSGMYAAIAERPAFDIDDEVVTFLRSRFKYDISPNVTRFRAFSRTQGNYTYMRVTGSVTTLQADACVRATRGTTVIDLAGAIYDPDELGNWRTYMKAALPAATEVQLLDCPPGFLERAVETADLETKLKIRSFALEYHCPTCETTTTNLIDVAENLEQLTEGTVPTARCPTCQSVLVAPATEAFLLLRRLPARQRDFNLDKFIAKARTEPPAKLEDVLTAKAAKPIAPGGTNARTVWVAGGLAALAIGGLGIAAVVLYKGRGDQKVVLAPGGGSAGTIVAPVAPQPALQRPDWVQSDVPSSAFCQETINRLTCVGVSSYRANRNEAVSEANDAALEELVNTVALKINDNYFKDRVLTPYSEARSKALSALQALDTDRNSKQYATADDVVRAARKRVVEILQASGGAAVPAQRSDWYWEEYQAEHGGSGSAGSGSGSAAAAGSGAVGPTEFLVFVRYDISLDAVKALVTKYSSPTAIGGSMALTAFPGLAWQHSDFTGGAVITKAGRPFTGVAAQQIVMAAGDQRVADATALAHKVEDWQKGTGDLKLTVKAGDDAPKTVDLKR